MHDLRAVFRGCLQVNPEYSFLRPEGDFSLAAWFCVWESRKMPGMPGKAWGVPGGRGLLTAWKDQPKLSPGAADGLEGPAEAEAGGC